MIPDGGPGRRLVVGNWKSNGDPGLVDGWARGFAGAWGPGAAVTVCVCPPHPLVARLRERLPGGILVGAQDVSAHPAGARTGEVSAEALAACGCRAAIVGHSERRALLGETDETVRRKVGRAIGAGLAAVLCVGETLEERERGDAALVVGRQLEAALPPRAFESAGDALPVAIAYEPVWAIGAGRTPTAAQIGEIHRHLSDRASVIAGNRVRIPVLYGGSVGASNIGDILSGDRVDGVLVGGASLDGSGFGDICRLAAAH